MEVTLYVALNNTNLEDFAEHVRFKFLTWARILWPNSASISKWKETQDGTVTIKAGISPGADVSLRIEEEPVGATQYYWSVSMFDPADLRDLDTSQDVRQKLSESWFMLDAIRYQRDRVEVVLTEAAPAKLEPIMLEWMRKHWREEGVEDLKKGGELPPEQNGSPRQWQPRSKADRWLIEQYFDAHQERKPLAYFKDDWLRLRREELIADPADSDNSMAQVISKERNKRGGE